MTRHTKRQVGRRTPSHVYVCVGGGGWDGLIKLVNSLSELMEAIAPIKWSMAWLEIRNGTKK